MSLTGSAGASPIDVAGVVASFLSIDPASLDRDRPLSLYGLDSLTSVELVAALERAAGRPLPEWLLVDHPTVNQLSRALAGTEMPPAAAAFGAMASDAVLPDDVRPETADAPAEPPEHALLTGATGFLGAYVLRALIEETTARVSCLVRSTGEPGLDRVRRNLERYGIWRSSMTDRIRVVAGDVALRGLGVPPEDSVTLAGTVDAIWHVAADVNWALPYASIRDANVGGTLEILRLACRSRRKSLHFVSSLSVGYAVDGPAVIDEDTDPMGFLERLPLGYAHTKSVAESLVRQAAARGLTASIHRPTFITGDSATGASNTDDFIASLVKGCIEMGEAPDLDWTVDALPVDYVAAAMLRLPSSRGLRTFHLTNAHPRHWRECVDVINEFGYPCALVPYPRWRARLDEDSRSPAHPLHGLRSFFLREHAAGATTPELYQDGRRSRIDATRTHALEAAAGLGAPRLSADLLGAYLRDFVRRGFLAPPRRPVSA